VGIIRWTRIGRIVLLLLTLLLLSANFGAAHGRDERTAEEYLKSRGYIVISSAGLIYTYTLDASKLAAGMETWHFIDAWAVQQTAPEAYYGKSISLYRFVVKDHPLASASYPDTNITVMMCEGRVIGGTSFPAVKEGDPILMGAPSSLDGRTLEEVTGLTYVQWLKQWEAKYGKRQQ
jgi:hypothetical protein